METIKNIAINTFYFFIALTFIGGSMMEYFGNPIGKFIMIPGLIFAIHQSLKSDN